MSMLTLPSAEPVSSGEFQVLDPERADEVDRRHAVLTEFLQHSSFDALLLTRPANIAWLTDGRRMRTHGETGEGPAVFVTPEARVVLCTNTESGQLFDRDIAGLGFQLKERPWEQPRTQLLEDLLRGRVVASDAAREGCANVGREMTALRSTLSDSDARKLRTLGGELAVAVEATCRTFERGQSESEIAGQVTHRLLRHGLDAVRVQVLADAQGHRYRHWTHGPDPVQRMMVLSVLARRDGLHAGCSRTVSFGTPPDTISHAHQVASLVQATGLYFSRPGRTADEVWPKVTRIYEKFGAADEWREAPQAETVGYGPSEMAFTPKAAFRLSNGMAVHWHPGVRTALASDTALCREDAIEVVTAGDRWPLLPIAVKGTVIQRPGILVRDEASEWAI